MINYYSILGISAHSSADEIRKAFRSRARETHPDLHPGLRNTDAFVQVNEAYAILSDTGKRAFHDRKLKEAERIKSQAKQPTPQSDTNARYEAAVKSAQVRAKKAAEMKFDEFQKSKYYKAESKAQLLMQIPLLLLGIAMGIFVGGLPFSMMWYLDWKFVFFGLVSIPVGYKIISQFYSTAKELRDYL